MQFQQWLYEMWLQHCEEYMQWYQRMPMYSADEYYAKYQEWLTEQYNKDQENNDGTNS